MDRIAVAALIAGSLGVAVLIGFRLRAMVPEHHLSAASKDAVMVAMGLVATMTALLLGLLVSSAKGSFDVARTEVSQLAAKVAFLDRILSAYGPEAVEARAVLHDVVGQSVRAIWSEDAPVSDRLAPDARGGDAFYLAVQALSPRDDAQRGLKTQAVTLTMQLGELRALLEAQSSPSISSPLLVVVVCWLVAIFVSFSVMTPPNGTTRLALAAAVVSVVGALLLLLELDGPFSGLVRISSQPMLRMVEQLAN